MFPGADAALIVRAHNHVAATYPWGARRIVTGAIPDAVRRNTNESSRQL